MINTPEPNVMRPYLIRALHEWCIDNGFTPYIAVSVDDSVQVPREFVKDGQIVLNLSFDATSSLQLGNDYIEFKARFAGSARQIMVPVGQVSAIYAKENGQGMAFPLVASKELSAVAKVLKKLAPVRDAAAGSASPTPSRIRLVNVELARPGDQDDSTRPPSGPTKGAKPALKRVK